MYSVMWLAEQPMPQIYHLYRIMTARLYVRLHVGSNDIHLNQCWSRNSHWSTWYFTTIKNVGLIKSSVDDLIMEWSSTVIVRVASVLWSPANQTKSPSSYHTNITNTTTLSLSLFLPLAWKFYAEQVILLAIFNFWKVIYNYRILGSRFINKFSYIRKACIP